MEAKHTPPVARHVERLADTFGYPQGDYVYIGDLFYLSTSAGEREYFIDISGITYYGWWESRVGISVLDTDGSGLEFVSMDLLVDGESIKSGSKVLEDRFFLTEGQTVSIRASLPEDLAHPFFTADLQLIGYAIRMGF